jgi:hypothetical protein
MDRQQLRRELHARVDQALEQAIEAVEAAPDGRWIAASEWIVRTAFQELTRDCFQAILQAKIDADPTSHAGSFSPGKPIAGDAKRAAGDAAVQRRSARRRAQRGR